MTWVDRLLGRPEPAEARAITSLPWGSYGVPFDQGGPAQPTAMTQDRALTLTPVFAANRIIAGGLSTLPLDTFRKIDDARIPMGTPPQLFQRLIATGQLVSWLHRGLTSLCLRGNAVGLVTARDGYEYPIDWVWLNPSEVWVDDSDSLARPKWYFRGRLIENNEDIIHIPFFPVAGRVWGLSPIAAFAETIGMGLYAQDYGNSWFEGGGFPPGTFKNVNVQEVPQNAADAIKNRLVTAIRTRRPVVFGSDWEYTPITVPPNEAQFLETIKASATQIANIYGLIPEDVGGSRGKSLEYATAELNAIERVQALRPYAVIFENAFNAVLPNAQNVTFNLDALVRADLKTRWAVHQVAVAMGARSIDEVRALENEAPLPDGQGQKYEKSTTTTPALPAKLGDNPTSARERADEKWSNPA